MKALRASSRRLLAFVEREIERGGGGRVTIYNDQLEMVGSRRVYVSGMAELAGLGFVDIERQPKRYLCSPTQRWRSIVSPKQALAVSAAARAYRTPPAQPASAGA